MIIENLGGSTMNRTELKDGSSHSFSILPMLKPLMVLGRAFPQLALDMVFVGQKQHR
jgi:hypothetical protein